MRRNFLMGFLGVNKTGKSSTALEIATHYKKTKPSSNEIWVHDTQKIFSSIADKNIDTENKEWAIECCELKNGLLILDEVKLLIPTPQHLPKGLLKLFSQSHYRNVDIIWMVHNPSSAPDVCTYYTTHYYIFLTFAREGSFRKKIPNYMLCTHASDMVNDYVKEYGRGFHKKDKRYNGQGFPHIIVDCEEQKLIAQNMNKKINSLIKNK